MAVTSVPRVIQCAETHKIALGLGIKAACWRKPATNSFSSMAFIGLPWPKKSTGMRSVLGPFNQGFNEESLAMLHQISHFAGQL